MVFPARQWRGSYRKIPLFQLRCVYLSSLWNLLIHWCQNAFSSKLVPFGFNVFSILVVDLMHEIELGVWKAIFIHLLRILDCQGENLKHELDRRQVSVKISRGLKLIFPLDFEKYLLSGLMV
jgi:hypothetical protein